MNTINDLTKAKSLHKKSFFICFIAVMLQKKE